MSITEKIKYLIEKNLVIYNPSCLPKRNEQRNVEDQNFSFVCASLFLSMEIQEQQLRDDKLHWITEGVKFGARQKITETGKGERKRSLCSLSCGPPPAPLNPQSSPLNLAIVLLYVNSSWKLHAWIQKHMISI